MRGVSEGQSRVLGSTLTSSSTGRERSMGEISTDRFEAHICGRKGQAGVVMVERLPDFWRCFLGFIKVICGTKREVSKSEIMMPTPEFLAFFMVRMVVV